MVLNQEIYSNSNMYLNLNNLISKEYPKQGLQDVFETIKNNNELKAYYFEQVTKKVNKIEIKSSNHLRKLIVGVLLEQGILVACNKETNELILLTNSAEELKELNLKPIVSNTNLNSTNEIKSYIIKYKVNEKSTKMFASEIIINLDDFTLLPYLAYEDISYFVYAELEKHSNLMCSPFGVANSSLFTLKLYDSNENKIGEVKNSSAFISFSLEKTIPKLGLNKTNSKFNLTLYNTVVDTDLTYTFNLHDVKLY